MDAEQWKDVVGFEGKYQVSDLGRVRSLDRLVPAGPGGHGRRLVKGRVLRPAPQDSGHLTVVLGRGNTKSVHTLVMRAFRGMPAPGLEVLHSNHQPADNRLANLEYGTRSQNLKMDYAVGKRHVPANFIGARWRARDAAVSGS